MKLDDTDKRIIELLMQNGRMSYVDIGKELGLSRVSVRERVNQLCESGVIEQFSIVINSELFGKKVSAFFEVDCEPNALVTADFLKHMPKKGLL
jgi:Lrp/AsnC family transcriptional regulator, leucine-responsive regulatory protein